LILNKRKKEIIIRIHTGYFIVLIIIYLLINKKILTDFTKSKELDLNLLKISRGFSLKVTPPKNLIFIKKKIISKIVTKKK
jgi:hypothetical protein